jgi:hypothetical protein
LLLQGTRIRKSTETSDRAKAEVIVRTFIMGVKRRVPADRLHAVFDAVCGLTNKNQMSEAGVPDDLAKRLGGWTEDATAARYDHAERVEELRAAVEKAKWGT